MGKDAGLLLVPFNPPLGIAIQEFGRGKPVLSIVSGLHGDEYNGLYICHLFIEWLRQITRQRGNYVLRGRVRLLPAANPLGLLVGERNWPFDNTDLDRVFPGYSQGETTQRVAHWIFENVRQSLCCVDLHSSNTAIEEWPQALVYSGQPRALDLAKGMGLPLVWVRRLDAHLEVRPQSLEMAGSVQGTLAYNLFQLGIDVVVVKAGVGLRLDLDYCRLVFASLIRLALSLGVVSGPEPEATAIAQVVFARQIHPVHCLRAGLFVPVARLGSRVEAGALLGQVLDPLQGELLEEVRSVQPGLLCTLRAHPLVFEGSLAARVAGS